MFTAWTTTERKAGPVCSRGSSVRRAVDAFSGIYPGGA